MDATWAERGAVLLAAAVPVTLLAVLLRTAGRAAPRGVSRRRVGCPVRGRPATVDFVLRGDGAGACAEVVGCSLVPASRPIDCGQVCRSTGVAPFGSTP
jgi:hypothetical protein